MNSSAVVQALESPAPLYALLDGARDRRVRNWVIDTHAAVWCLYRGKIPAALENAAPWLLRLSPGQPYTEEFFRHGFGEGWGIVLASGAPSRELRRHLRRFLRVRAGSRILTFRYYDPRVLRLYLPTCTPAEVAAFFGPVAAIAAPDGEERPAVFRPMNAAPQPWSGKLWTIREEQLSVLGLKSMEPRVVAHAQKFFRRQSEALGAAGLAEAVQHGLSRAQSHGIATERDACKYVNLMFAFGRDFDAQLPWAHRILADRAQPRRFDGLFEAALAHLNEARGYVEDPDADEIA